MQIRTTSRAWLERPCLHGVSLWPRSAIRENAAGDRRDSEEGHRLFAFPRRKEEEEEKAEKELAPVVGKTCRDGGDAKRHVRSKDRRPIILRADVWALYPVTHLPCRLCTVPV